MAEILQNEGAMGPGRLIRETLLEKGNLEAGFKRRGRKWIHSGRSRGEQKVCAKQVCSEQRAERLVPSSPGFWNSACVGGREKQ